MNGLCAIVLAAGSGTRLRPLSDLVPKALCPVGNEPLADGAIRRCRSAGITDVAVNAHALANQIVEHYRGSDVVVRVEPETALGTAGGVANLRDWIDGRHVLVHNADAWHDADLASFVDGWDRRRIRVLAVDGGSGEFGGLDFAGVSLMSWQDVRELAVEPTGLWEVLWRDRWEAGGIEVVRHDGDWFDCGTPQTYLAANLCASGGASVIAPDATVGPGAEVIRSVVWPRAEVVAGERLVDCIRAPGGLTVDARAEAAA